MKLLSGSRTDVGRVRDHNEDSIFVDLDTRLYVVADGVGGGQAGEVASSMLTGILARRMAEAQAQLDAEKVLDIQARTERLMKAMTPAIAEASERIYERGQADQGCRGMATTSVALQISGQSGIIGHVGDSRLYMIRESRIYQITEDHTLVQQLKSRGALSEEEIERFPHRHVLSRSVGIAPTVEVDLLVVDVVEGDRFLLCSDGLHDLLSPEDILATVSPRAPQPAANALVDLANERGGRDNITVIVVEVHDDMDAAEDTVVTMRSEQKADYLSKVFLFKDLSFQQTMLVLRAVRDVFVQDGHVIFREGDPGDRLFIVVEGMVEVSQGGVHLTTIGPGGHFGELGLIAGGVRSATVTACGEVAMLAIGREDFFGLVNSQPEVAVRLLWGFLQNLAGRTKQLTIDFANAMRDKT